MFNIYQEIVQCITFCFFDVTLDEAKLTSDDEEILAKASMLTVASIVYEKENYMAWLMEQLNFTKEEQ